MKSLQESLLDIDSVEASAEAAILFNVLTRKNENGRDVKITADQIRKIVIGGADLTKDNTFKHNFGDASEYVMNFIKDNNLDEMVKFVGWVSGDAKSKILSTTDILVLPSYYEGLPISVLEAMSYAMPVITTPVGGIPEVVTDGVEGTLFTPGDKASLTQAIDKYIENPRLIAGQGLAALEKSQMFSPLHISSQLSQIIE